MPVSRSKPYPWDTEQDGHKRGASDPYIPPNLVEVCMVLVALVFVIGGAITLYLKTRDSYCGTVALASQDVPAQVQCANPPNSR